jgi:hypothetical protein
MGPSVLRCVAAVEVHLNQGRIDFKSLAPEVSPSVNAKAKFDSLSAFSTPVENPSARGDRFIPLISILIL